LLSYVAPTQSEHVPCILLDSRLCARYYTRRREIR
jgi:hypothetical protein